MMRSPSNGSFSKMYNKSNSKSNLMFNGGSSSSITVYNNTMDNYDGGKNEANKNRKLSTLTSKKVFLFLLLVSNLVWMTFYCSSHSKALSFFKDHSTLWNLERKHMEYAYDHKLHEIHQHRPLIIAHRGDSGNFPEHTKEAYVAAIEAGADAIECDVGLSYDGYLICLHESWMSEGTDVVDKFPPSRKKEYLYDGHVINDFFSVDFTIEELMTLRKVQSKKSRSKRYDGQYQIATLQEFMKIAFSSNRTLAVYVEIKDPDFNNDHVKGSASFEELVIDELHRHGCSNEAYFRCVVQSFSLQSLQAARKLTKLPLLLLTKPPTKISDEQLQDFSGWMYAVGPRKDQLMHAEEARSFIERCHKRGLKVQPYSFRNEYIYLHSDFKHDAYLEMAFFFSLHVDGYFTDFPSTTYFFLNALYLFFSS